MYAIIKKGGRTIWDIRNTLDEIIPEKNKKYREMFEYSLHTFGCLQGEDCYYYYIADTNYENGKTIYLWYHLLKTNIMEASYNPGEVPTNILVKTYKYYSFK